MERSLKTLSPEEEIAYMRDVLKMEAPTAFLDRIVGHFTILQARAGLMLSLITICLTISGFSGHRIAAAGWLPASLLSLGLCFAVLSAILLFLGPLRLRWATQHACQGPLENTLVAMLKLRNLRTHRYHVAGFILLLGLTCYMSSVILFVLKEGFGL
ncbi:hypothetical protein P3T73_01255 [Kiritimatiellota bacterium B12222]|nr:hypothetical protein P3T73_01255 [Kiritimatiellota bacterium B12222]